MGACWSDRIKAVIPFHTGFTSNSVNRYGNDIDSSSKLSSSSLTLTPRGEGEILQSSNLKSFSFGELKISTRNFHPGNVLGEDGFGSVFKGWIDEKSLAASSPGSGMAISVERIIQNGFPGHKEWLAEINYLGQLHHPNLVKLIGYCLADELRFLVYEFMPKGSLENHLFRRGSLFQPLPWNLRLKIARGAARGLAFLHSTEPKVFNRDFKTANILLDSNYNAKFSYFELDRDEPIADETNEAYWVFGTCGNAPPLYRATGHLTAESDVHSFGVVLLELLSGRRAIDNNRPSGECNLVEWAKPHLSNKHTIFRVMDVCLEGQYSLSRAQKAANLALRCLAVNYRPSMDEVVRELEQLLDSKDT